MSSLHTTYDYATIRNVVLAELKADSDAVEVAAVQGALRAPECPGTLSYTIGDDAGLRDGNWNCAIVADFADAHAYRAYDADVEHNRLRARLDPFAERVARVQLEIAAA